MKRESFELNKGRGDFITIIETQKYFQLEVFDEAWVYGNPDPLALRVKIAKSYANREQAIEAFKIVVKNTDWPS